MRLALAFGRAMDGPIAWSHSAAPWSQCSIQTGPLGEPLERAAQVDTKVPVRGGNRVATHPSAPTAKRYGAKRGEIALSDAVSAKDHNHPQTAAASS